MKILYLLMLIFTLSIFIYFLKVDKRKFILIGLILFSFFINGVPFDLIGINGLSFSIQLFFIYLSVLYFLHTKRKSNVLNFYTLYFLLVILIVLISNNSLDFSNYGWSKTFWLIFKAFIPLIGISLLSPFYKEDFKVIFFIFLLGSLLTSLKLLGFGTLGVRSSFGETNPITIGREIGFGLTISLLYLLYMNGNSINLKDRIFIIVISIVYFYALLLTGSRGPLLSILITVICSFLFFKSKSRAIFRVIVFCIILFALARSFDFSINNLSINNPSIDRLLYYTQNFGENSSDEGRIDRIKVAIKGFKESHMLGVGTGGFSNLYPSSSGKDYPHNMFFEFLVEQGLIGVLVYLMLVIIVVLKLYEEIEKRDIYQKIILILWFYSFVNSMISADISGNFAFWILGGVSWLSEKIYNSDNKNNVSIQRTTSESLKTQHQ